MVLPVGFCQVRSTAMGLLGATGRLASFTTTFLAGGAGGEAAAFVALIGAPAP